MTSLSDRLSPRGRLKRSRFLLAGITLVAVFLLLFSGLESTLGRASTLLLYPPFFWLAFVLGSRRLHDRDKSAAWLLLLLVPLLGPAWLLLELSLLRGSPGTNRHGPDPRAPDVDYLKVA
jgi:uncharacterized membrane protein YhaH (DUF805 family)